MPLVISRPGHLKAGTTSDALTTQADVLPTLCDLAGLPAPPDVDGQSLRPLLEQAGDWQRGAIFSEYYSKQRWVNPARAVRTERWKLVEYLQDGRELYDLENDPHEARNLAGDPARHDVELELLTLLDQWAGETNDSLWFEHRPRELR